ncbi:MAG: tyrosine-type recombinase/integrase [Clostridia bacterium]|nr:tyrosine-type recombinase/integrase [Clostridia bacterium]
MTIECICDLCLEAVKNAGYKESTIRNYRGVVRRFKEFCVDHGIKEYSCDIGKLYADDVISNKTRKYSINRYHTQGRFIRLLDSYFVAGEFDFAVVKKGKISPANLNHKLIYNKYQSYLHSIYDNENTVHFYEYGMYCVLQYLDKHKIFDLSDLHSQTVIKYISQTKITRQREVLCELRGIFRYLKRDDLLIAIAGIHAPRIKRIIPILSEGERKKIEEIITECQLSKRDAAIVIVGLSCGIRACDLINLKLSDINWNNDILSFKQSKTGNRVCLPLTASVGNAIARYIIEERPDINNDVLFLRSFAPYTPFTSHSSCYAVVKKFLIKAGIQKDSRIWGMHFLRHNAASTMVKNEVPIETIAAVLGHSTPDTTDIYITTDVKMLKECVLPMRNISVEVNS